MLSILKDIPDFALSCELEDFTVMTDKAVLIQIKRLGSELFAASYVPDANKEIHFRDLCSILESYLTDEPMQRFSYTISATNEQMITKSFDVLLCRYNVSESGTQFVSSHFLTSLIGRKIIGAQSTEFLYYTNGSTTSATSDTASAQCVYVTGQNTIVTENKAVSTPGIVGINKIDVSPSLFAKNDMELVRYIITCGSRRMRYDITDRPSAASIRFKNNFGCLETFTFAGSIEIDPRVERSAALINGHRVNFDTRQEVHYKCYSSYIPSDMLFFADDIAKSEDVSFVVDDQRFPVAIVDGETTRDNSSFTLNSFWIEFVAASNRGFRLPELTRIFDESFDKTYN